MLFLRLKLYKMILWFWKISYNNLTPVAEKNKTKNGHQIMNIVENTFFYSSMPSLTCLLKEHGWYPVVNM